jgi:ABC-type multidrug transport system fused ATPase/permease subunit
MSDFKKHKWKICWAAFILLVIVFVYVAIFLEDRPWIGNVIQIMSTVLALYITVIIFLQSKAESDQQFRRQLDHLQELNASQIEALHKTTERQIEALKESTFNQIASFEKQTNEIASKLSDNSILLAEILGRELEKSIEITEVKVQQEENKYADLSSWKLLRTTEEKEAQLTRQRNRLTQVKKMYEYLVKKYQELRNYFGMNDSDLMD